MGVDWNEVHLRLEEAAAALEQGATPSEEKRRSILRERARALALETGPAATAKDLIDVIEFRLASEAYAIEYSYVREVHPLRDFTPLPGTPPFILGIVNLRGQIISVVDLRVFFNLPAKGLGDLNKVIVVRDERMEFGILADEVTGVRAIPRISIQPPIPTLSGIGSEYLIGITDEGMLVLDANTILRDERIIVEQK
ncbi:MAG: chemotaxis protein CheW [Rectinemataceae bacterium]|jgi:purine-binding chemotaxis protein CheW